MKAKEKDPKIFIQHILESIDKIEKYTEGQVIGKFLNNYEKQDAVIRRIEIIGEAVKNLPRFFKNKHSVIPWKKIAGM
jgi:uncharacterized protein with HEPN domain